MDQIPTPDSISAAWFTQILRDRGVMQDGQVSSIQGNDVGTGQVGRCIRYDIEYSGTNQALPHSFVIKFSSDDPTSRDTGQALRTYRTEVDFYNHIAPQLDMRVPDCYYAAIDEQDRDHIVVMQDLAPAEQGDQIAGCSTEVARAAVLELVGLHAPTWRDERWQKLLGRVQDGPFANMKGFYHDTVGEFVSRYTAQLPEEHIRFIEAIDQAQACPMFEFHGADFALEHYDYRLDNVMIDAANRVTTVDWQSVRVGKPLNDVAYFIGSALDPEVRRSVEVDILREYHEQLLAAGVADFSWETCYRDYRKGVYAGFAVSIISPVLVVRTDRGDEMFTTMARRFAQMALDLEVDEFMQG